MTAEQMVMDLRDKSLEPPDPLYESAYEVPESDICEYREEYGYEDDEPLSMFTKTELDSILKDANRRSEYVTDVRGNVIFYIPEEGRILW